MEVSAINYVDHERASVVQFSVSSMQSAFICEFKFLFRSRHSNRISLAFSLQVADSLLSHVNAALLSEMYFMR